MPRPTTITSLLSALTLGATSVPVFLAEQAQLTTTSHKPSINQDDAAAPFEPEHHSSSQSLAHHNESESAEMNRRVVASLMLVGILMLIAIAAIGVLAFELAGKQPNDTTANVALQLESSHVASIPQPSFTSSSRSSPSSRPSTSASISSDSLRRRLFPPAVVSIAKSGEHIFVPMDTAWNIHEEMKKEADEARAAIKASEKPKKKQKKQQQKSANRKAAGKRHVAG